MARTGRPPKPTHLKLVTGNPGRRPIKKGEPKPEAGRVAPPAHLSEVALAEWHRVMPQLLALRLFTPLDRSALAAYCVAYARWVEAENVIAKVGPITKAPKTGVPMHNPFLAVANAAMAQMERFGAKFGLSPVDRVRLATNAGSGQANEDPADRFFG